MEITVILTELEEKVLAHEHEDLQRIVQDIVTGNIQERIRRLAEQRYRQTKVDINPESILGEMFDNPDYKNADEKAVIETARGN
ncbi:hypothetical protein LCGC14_3125260 [marine sediment metagenome]|uniref:Uncharacterized protein n=1 Tax=marine sediment metagenome TaxID=412755 RepID=A0A0F8WQ31_9ZZZZ